jgi:hypothetical protein
MQKDLDPVLDEVRLEGAVSQKTGKPYKKVVIKLINGYEMTVFPHPAEMSVIEALLDAAK